MWVIDLKADGAVRLGAAALVAAVVLAAPGCSDQTAEAKPVLQSAYSSTRSLAGDLLELDEWAETFLADYEAGVNTEPAGVAANIKELTRKIEELQTKASEARGGYEQVSKMKVPGEWRDFCRHMLSTIDQAAEVRAAFDRGFTAIRDADPMKGPDPTTMEESRRTLDAIDEKLAYNARQARTLESRIGLDE